ncbi:hypothetical protein DXT87_12195 [Arthrobacter sp. AET 35A]|nr:hypothetical protein [Arthrobacter sp. AET 35A]
MTKMASWRFTWLTLKAMLFHRSTAGDVVIYWIAPLALAASTVALSFVWSPGFAITALLLFVAGELAMVHLLEWSGWCATRYVNKEQTLALVVKVLSDGSWKPDTHVKEPEVSKEDTAAFRVSVMAHLLEAANRNAVILRMTARDEKLLKSYEQDLKKAQEQMGIPLADFQTIEIEGKNWIRGFNCAVKPSVTASGRG